MPCLRQGFHDTCYVRSETCFRLALCAVLQKWAVLKHALNWYCAIFIVSKPHVKFKVLKHKNFCKETKSMAKLLNLFVCFFLSFFLCFLVMNVGPLQIQ